MDEVENPTVTTNSEDTWRDPQDKIWSIYVSRAAPIDKALVERWKGDMDGILIFAGLFSAVLTAFILKSYDSLQQDTSTALLKQISQQLANPSLADSAPSKFKPTPSVVRVNAYWFLSLACSLQCALAATLVQQWACNYRQAVESHSSPHKRARIRFYLKEGVDMFGVTTFVNAIPTLLHISLLLFLVGLFEFLLPTNSIIAYLLLGILAVCTIIYFAITILPILYQNSPYRTQLSQACWRILITMRLVRFRNAEGRYVPISEGISHFRDRFATAPSRDRRVRDEMALRGMLELFTDDREFEPFIAGIPDFLSAANDDLGIDLWERFHGEDIKLGNRITNLLVTCRHGGVLPETTRHQRAQTCLNAIWSLAHVLVVNRPANTPHLTEWLVSQDTVAAIAGLKDVNSLVVAIHLSCTIAMVSCKILEHWNTSRRRVGILEQLNVLEFLDVYKFLKPLRHMLELQRRTQEQEEKSDNWQIQERNPSPLGLEDPSLEHQLEQELGLLKQEGYFGVFIALIFALTDLPVESQPHIASLPMAINTLKVIINRFPTIPPSNHTQDLLVQCLHRAICGAKSSDCPTPGQSPSPNEEARKRSSSLACVAPPHVLSKTTLPAPLVDSFLLAVIQVLVQEDQVQKATKIITSYHDIHVESLEAMKALSRLKDNVKSIQ